MKDETILLRVTAEEKKKLSQKAESAGLSLSAYVRRCCEGEAPKPVPPPDFWEDLQKLYLLHGSCRAGGHGHALHKTGSGRGNYCQQRSVLSMEMNVMDDKKLVTIWLTNADQQDERVEAALQDIYREYEEKKYFVTVFKSGRENLYDYTLDLLRYNRKRSAEREVQRAKSAGRER